MQNKRRILGLILLPVGGILINAARAEYLRPRDAAAQENIAPKPVVTSLRLKADLSDKILYVEQDGKVVKSYTISDGREKYPTPRGTFRIDKVVWNPEWVPPPDAKWAKGKTAKAPGHPDNPMKLVKIFFKEPDYYIHGTDRLDNIGEAASHGCIRMDPIEAAELAIMVMEASGAQKDSTWYQRAIERGQTRTVSLPQQVQMTISD
ncbi:MAG TPA: L,D-transpeptidase [Gemmatimonadaceae bacterium]|nr:L,D-transpeptidase [Gemmatimonadaceae bacterium]